MDFGWYVSYHRQCKEFIAQAVSANSLLGVSDGSFVKDALFGTAGWISEDKGRHTSCSGKAITPGPPDSQCSYQKSELLGL